MIAALRHLFRHRHRPAEYASLMALSLASGAPVCVAKGSICRCGHVLERDITPAGLQQISWGASCGAFFEQLDLELGLALRDDPLELRRQQAIAESRPGHRPDPTQSQNW